MLQFLANIKEQINFFYTVFEYFFYFLIGFLFLVLLKYAKNVTLSLVKFSNKFRSKEGYIYVLKRFVSILFFIILSIFIGKIVIFIL